MGHGSRGKGGRRDGKASAGISHAAAGRPAVGLIGRGFEVMCVMNEIFGVTESGTEPAEG